jgi:hypothetical protein
MKFGKRDNWVPVTTAWGVLGLRMEERPPIRRVAANISNKQSRTADKGGPPAWGLGEVLTSPHRKKVSCCESFNRVSKAGTCECGNEPSGSIKCGEFLDYLRTGLLLKKDSAPWSV